MPKLLASFKMKKGEVKTISCRDNGKKRKIRDGVIKNIIKPSCVIDYNKAVYNAYLLYSKIINTTKIIIVSFCLNIAEELLENITLPNYKSRGRFVSGDTPLCLQQYNTGAFFDRLITGAEKWVHIFQTIIVGLTETGLNKSAHGSEKDTSGWALSSPFATLYEKIIHVR
ncbi:hypothetical protein HZH68_016152 [Vespula germanica]|uniref:Uncharacterized protein n=1 Tax=Vespula germanica TaxID=30212 RepID=A0A834J4C5_VESGE|nr:hypothetical protein HZH68_016152 [Vespula germanica]